MKDRTVKFSNDRVGHATSVVGPQASAAVNDARETYEQKVNRRFQRASNEEITEQIYRKIGIDMVRGDFTVHFSGLSSRAQVVRNLNAGSTPEEIKRAKRRIHFQDFDFAVLPDQGQILTRIKNEYP